MLSPASPRRLLIVESDADTRAIVETLLTEEGYSVVQAASPAEALALLDEQVFHLILTDLFVMTPDDPLRSVVALRQRAQPTPVGILTGWHLSYDAARRNGFVCLIRKPFDLDEILTAVVSCLETPLSPTQQSQAKVLTRFFEALSTRDWETVNASCAAQVVCYPPQDSLYAPVRRLAGWAAYRAYVEDVFQRLSFTRFEEVLIYGHPKGLAARYIYGWRSPDGRLQRQAGASLFHFSDQLIARIGVKVRQGRIRRLIAQQRLEVPGNGQG
jgi:CheY-like chemotaxis protein